MHVDLEDVLALIDEVLELSTKRALVAQAEVHKQYALLGAVEGVRDVRRKLVNHYGRDSF